MPAPTIPEGQTLLQVLEVSWPNVPIKKNGVDVPISDLLAESAPAAASDKQVWATTHLVPTGEFLDACTSLTVVFDALGSAALDKIVKVDIQNNVAKLRERFLAKPLESATIQDLCLGEIKDKAFKATEGFVWLIRTLNFTLKALKRNVEDHTEELSVSFKNAYSDSLSNTHNFIMRGVAMGAWSLVPYRADFYKKLGNDQDKVKTDLIAYLAALEKFVEILRAFIETEPAIIPKKFKTF